MDEDGCGAILAIMLVIGFGAVVVYIIWLLLAIHTRWWSY